MNLEGLSLRILRAALTLWKLRQQLLTDLEGLSPQSL